MKRDNAQFGKETLFVLYDAKCNLCLATVKRLNELRTSAELRFVSAQSVIEGTETTVPVPGPVHSLIQINLLAKLHVVDGEGRIYAGADGIVRIMRTVPGLSWMAVLYRIPGLSRTADAVYRYVASRRYDWFGKADESCGDEDACAIPQSRPENEERRSR